MPSVGDVTAQMRAACAKAEQARTALEQAEDLAEEARDTLARALEGAHHLEADKATTLSRLTQVVDGCKGHLWPLLTEALKAAQALATHLEDQATPPPAQQPAQPAPSTQPSPRPPTQQTDPDGPPVIPPERIEQLRRELPPPVARGTGQKTHGRWIGPDGTVEQMVSGRDDDWRLAEERLKQLGMPFRSTKTSDVEMKVAARMAERGIKHAVVVINWTPCKGPFGCDTLVPVLLPEGATLTVHGVAANGTRFRKRYTGGAQPWWRS